MRHISIFILFTISLFANNNLHHKHILILHSYNKSMSWETNIDKAIDDILEPNKNNYIIHREYMDTKRIFTEEYLQNLKTLYKNKYKNVKFDLILSSDNNAFNFLRKNRDELFGNTPVSFCGVNFFKDSDLDGLMNYTGASEIFNAKKTVDLALKLNPNIKNIYVINDYLPTGKAWTKTIKEQLKDIDKNIIYVKNSSIENLKLKLKSLNKKDSMVLLGVYFKDKNGKYFTYEKIGEIISKSSIAPVFCLLKFNIGKGVVGGSVIGGYFQGAAMSNIGKKILNGVLPKNIPVQKDGATKLVLDYNVLVKYGMNIENIPKNAIILNKPISLFEKHKFVIIVSLVITFILLTIIVALLINIKQRKNIQKELLLSQKEIKEINENLESEVKERTIKLENQKNEFEAMYNGSKDGMAILDLKSNFLDVNPAYIELTGMSKEELLSSSCLKLTPNKNIQTSIDAIEEVIKVGFIKDYEKECIVSNDRYLTVNMSMSLLKNPDRILINVRDVTQQKKNKELLNNLNNTLRYKIEQEVTKSRQKDKQMLHQSRLAQMGEMISMIAHQWRQPLNSISLTSSNLKIKCIMDDVDRDYFEKELDLIGEYSEHLSKTIDDFRGFFKDNKVKETTTLENIVNSTLDIVKVSVENRNIKIITSFNSNEEIETYPNELKQVVLNLIKNSEDILLENKISNPTITIKTSLNNELTVSDNAGGIPEDIKDKIFDPYFSTKLEKDGTGLGLYMSKTIIEEHCGGKLSVENDSEGAVFTIKLFNFNSDLSL